MSKLDEDELFPCGFGQGECFCGGPLECVYRQMYDALDSLRKSLPHDVVTGDDVLYRADLEADRVLERLRELVSRHNHGDAVDDDPREL